MTIPSKSPIILFALLISLSSVHAAVVLDGTLGAKVALEGPRFLIEETLGKQMGGNLFHSFDSFTINTGESATFAGSHSVENVISRVTGSNASWIDGTLRSTIPNANVYLLNPNGILFGKNASLDISGSFHASTANVLHLGEDGFFNVSNPSNSQLTVSPPASFGFLDNTPSEISIKGSRLQVSPRKTLSLVGGDLQINEGTLYAPDGHINLVSMASMGKVIPGLSNTAGKLGTITLSKSPDTALQNIEGHEIANIDTSGISGGDIFIQSGKFFSTGGHIYSKILNQNHSVQDNTYQRGKISILAQEAMKLSKLSDISVDSEIGTSNHAGNIAITTQTMMMTDRSAMSSKTFGSGHGGDITITATTDLTLQHSSISTASEQGMTGEAGDIQLAVGQLTLQEGGLLNSGTLGTGKGGDITINATQGISLLTQGIRSRIASSVGNIKTEGTSGNGGDINIVTPWLRIKEGSAVQTNTFGSTIGNAGNIQIDAKHLVLENGGIITTSTAGSGIGGHIDISSMNTEMTGGLIISSSVDKGNAGSITITTKTASLTDESFLSSLADISNGGDIILNVYDHLTLTNRSGITSQLRHNAPQEKNAGNIQINANHLRLFNRASINATTLGDGVGGNIEISSDYLEGNNALITAQSIGKGNAGSINLTANIALLAQKSAISTEAREAGGGDITLNVSDNLYLTNSAITAEARGNQPQDKGGNLTIKSLGLFTFDNSQLRAKAYAGNGGDIDISTPKFNVLGDSAIDVSSSLGLNGKLRVNSLELNENLVLFSHSFHKLELSLNQCVTSKKGLSSFTITNRDGLLASPEELMR